ncbi:hypothetical protein AgCh_010669 [Apium graveolens]
MKFKSDGSIERFKARLVILGYKQVYVVDYENTFAPMAKMTTIRALLAVAAVNDWMVVQMDVTNAFLHGFVQSKSDYSLFTLTNDSSITLVLAYVDDLLIAGNSGSEIDDLKRMLSAKFHMKDLSELRYFLGLEVDRNDAGFFVSQHKYLVDILKEFNMQAATPMKIRKDVHLRLTKEKVGTSTQGILLASTSTAQLHAYSDSDWATCPMTQRSTTGFSILFGSGPISWKTKKEAVIARSSAEAEYRAMALTSCEVTWLQALLKDLGLHNLPPAMLHCDNKSAIAIAANPVLHERTKHIEVECHYIHDKINSGTITTTHTPTHSQLADVLTKGLSAKQHFYLLSKLGVQSRLPTKLDGE